MPTTRVIVKKDGSVEIEGVGYVGNACLEDLQQLQDALKKYGINIEIVYQEKKPEAYVAEVEAATQGE